MKKKLLSLLLLPLSLNACTQKLSLEFNEYKDYVDLIDTHSDVNMDGENPIESATYFRNGKVQSVSLGFNAHGLTEVKTLKQISASRDGKSVFTNEGDLKLAVVPVTFAEQNVNPEEQEQKRVLLQNAFFGDSRHNSYESVASYYNKSSYGKVKITGQVVDWFECEYTLEKALRESRTSGEEVSRKIAAQVADYLHELSNDDTNDFNLEDYDTDEDGNIDGIYIVYDYPQDNSSIDRSPLLWAYFDKVTANHDGHNKVAPYGSSYSWSSFYFTGESALEDYIVDSSTYIHETGHLFGLDDYYNTSIKAFDSKDEYNKNVSGVFQPTGFMDMMDYNLGDHCSFSKYILDWASPYVIQNEGTITLKSFTKTGDFAIIPNPNWNGTAFDEYLILEYFTPDDLNCSYNFPSYAYLDGDNIERVFNYPNRHGLRVYHVDARLGYYAKRSMNSEKCLVDASEAELNRWIEKVPDVGYIDFYNTNATQGPVDSNKQVLLHLLEADGKNNLLNGIGASNTTLFGMGSSFGYNVYKDFVFNKKTSSGDRLTPEFKFKISKLDSQEITIKIEKR